MFNVNNRPGQFYQQHKRRVMNRTGGDITLSGVYAIDILASPTAETTAGEGVGGITGLDLQDAYFHNIDDVHASTLNGLLVVVTSLLSGGGSNDTEVEVTLCGQRIPCEVNGGTVDVIIGDMLVGVAGANHLVSQGDGAVDEKVVALALESHTADTQVIIDVIFFGALPMTGGGINS